MSGPAWHKRHSIRARCQSSVSPTCARTHSAGLENLHLPGADNDLFLAEHGFEAPAIVSPPGPVELRRHDLEHHDVVAVGPAFVLPQAVGGRAGGRRHPTEALAELAADLGIKFLAECAADVVVQRQQDLNELHGAGCGSTRQYLWLIGSSSAGNSVMTRQPLSVTTTSSSMRAAEKPSLA